MRSNDKTRFWIMLASALSSTVLLFVFSLSFPLNKWDLLGHLGGALHFSIDNPDELHHQVYLIARDTLPEVAYQDLLVGNTVRTAWADDPSAFFQTLPFYEPRVLVTIPTYLAYEWGFNPIRYMQLQSSLAASLGVLFFFLAFARSSPTMVSVCFPLLLLITGVLDVARFEGADALAFCGYAAAIYLAYKRSIWVLLVIALLPLTRSDMIIFSLLALGYYGVSCRNWRAFAVAACILALSLYLGVNGAFNNYGWVKQFYVAQIEYLSHPADVKVSISIADYLMALARGGIQLIYNIQFQIFVFFFGMVAYVVFAGIEKSGFRMIFKFRVENFCILAVMFVLAHFLVFPSMHTRYFAAQYLHLSLVFIVVLSRSSIGRENGVNL